jgi:hypothetical protein
LNGSGGMWRLRKSRPKGRGLYPRIATDQCRPCLIAPIVAGAAPIAVVSFLPLLVIIHALAATVWTGGHLVLDLGVLPRALRAQSAAQIRAFEVVFEPLGLTALAIQVFTGLWMAWIYLPG